MTFLFPVRNILKFKNKISNIKYNSTLSKNIVKSWREKLENAEIEDAEFSIKCILSHVLNKKFNDVGISEIHNLTPEQCNNFERYCECRLARMPLQYIISEWDFHDITLKMIPTVFIPRPETEGLVSLVLKDFDHGKPFRFMDVGCGSGAIALSVLKSSPKSECIALDRSKLACQLTEENAKILGLNNRIKVYNHIMKEDSLLPESVEGDFDAIISNPPYVKTKDLIQLQPEIKLYENLNALDGGPDGLKVVKVLLKLAQERIVDGGKLWLEVDPEHPKVLEEIIESKFKGTLRYLNTYNDIFQKERFVEILKFNGS